MSDKSGGSRGCADLMLGTFLAALWFWTCLHFAEINAFLERLIR